LNRDGEAYSGIWARGWTRRRSQEPRDRSWYRRFPNAMLSCFESQQRLTCRFGRKSRHRDNSLLGHKLSCSAATEPGKNLRWIRHSPDSRPGDRDLNAACSPSTCPATSCFRWCHRERGAGRLR